MAASEMPVPAPAAPSVVAKLLAVLAWLAGIGTAIGGFIKGLDALIEKVRKRRLRKRIELLQAVDDRLDDKLDPRINDLKTTLTDAIESVQVENTRNHKENQAIILPLKDLPQRVSGLQESVGELGERISRVEGQVEMLREDRK